MPESLYDDANELYKDFKIAINAFKGTINPDFACKRLLKGFGNTLDEYKKSNAVKMHVKTNNFVQSNFTQNKKMLRENCWYPKNKVPIIYNGDDIFDRDELPAVKKLDDIIDAANNTNKLEKMSLERFKTQNQLMSLFEDVITDEEINYAGVFG